MSRIHISLPNAYKMMLFDRNVNGNRDVKFLEFDYLLVQQSGKLTLKCKFSKSCNDKIAFLNQIGLQYKTCYLN